MSDDRHPPSLAELHVLTGYHDPMQIAVHRLEEQQEVIAALKWETAEYVRRLADAEAEVLRRRADLERTTEALLECEAQNDALRAQLAQAHSAARLLANLDAAAAQFEAWPGEEHPK